jgi:DNA-binding helix-hairpin-helix protein with protein kinase domain
MAMAAPAQGSRLQSGTGAAIVLEDRLGGGGEGAVYTVRGRPDVVAKIYNGALSPERRQKLEAMAGAAPAQLLQITAWPIELVRSAGDVIGFLMPRAVQAEELHVLYGPKSRKQRFPHAGYKFLVHAAMNVARALAVVHRQGIVVGDVNERVAMIAPDSTVRLIDCDSFQIRAGGRTFGCEVGVPLFTPPELQTVPTLRGVERTEQHDLFGLAVLIFHLLFLGRHPFSGRNSARPDMTIETAIREHRFAYSADRQRTGMTQPTIVPPLQSAGGDIARLFEAAFAPAAALGVAQRPTAAQWADALAALQATLVACTVNAAHAYASSLSACPWCAIELTTGIELFNYVEPAGGDRQPPVDVEAIWQAIEAIAPVAPPAVPDPTVIKDALYPSPEALLVRQAGSEQASIASAVAARTAAEQEVEAKAQLVQAAEAAVSAARLFLESYEADSLRLPELRDRQKRADAAASRWRYLQYGALALTVAGVAWGFLQPAWRVPALLISAGALIAVTILRGIKERQAEHLTRDLQALLVSAALGREERQRRLEAAERALEAARQTVIAAQGKLYSAMVAVTEAGERARVRRADADLARAGIEARYHDAGARFSAALSRHQALAAGLARLQPVLLACKSDAQRIYAEVGKIESRRKSEHRGARAQSREAQLNAYLDQFFIMHESWPRQLPKSVLAALSSYGIETARDIERDAVAKVPGFGKVRTELLLAWRKRKAAGFRFDEGRTEHTSKVDAVDVRLDTERLQQARLLKKAYARLEALVAGPAQQHAQLAAELTETARDFAQALKDMEALGPAGQVGTPAPGATGAAAHHRARKRQQRP